MFGPTETPLNTTPQQTEDNEKEVEEETEDPQIMSY